MKLSGAFNELDPSPFSAISTTTSPKEIEEILESLSPVLETVQSTFSGRIMFGSDWPVCNVGGPGDRSWSTWKQVVETWIKRGDEDEDNIWWKAGSEAYGIDAEKFGSQEA
jgi:L-rhamnono-1,4-lactonase